MKKKEIEKLYNTGHSVILTFYTFCERSFGFFKKNRLFHVYVKLRIDHSDHFGFTILNLKLRIDRFGHFGVFTVLNLKLRIVIVLTILVVPLLKERKKNNV